MSLQSSSVGGPRPHVPAVVRYLSSSARRPLSSYTAQQFSKPFPHRIAQHLFNRTIGFLALRVLAATCRHTQSNPIRGPIAATARSRRINERFQKVNRMPVDPLPIPRQHQWHPSQDVGCQMRDPNPGRDQEPCVVRNEANVAPPGFGCPSDEASASFISVSCSCIFDSIASSLRAISATSPWESRFTSGP
jgi:hypothetical protein